MDRASEIARASSWISFLLFSGIGIFIYFTASTLISFFIPEDQQVIDG